MSITVLPSIKKLRTLNVTAIESQESEKKKGKRERERNARALWLVLFRPSSLQVLFNQHPTCTVSFSL